MTCGRAGSFRLAAPSARWRRNGDAIIAAANGLPAMKPAEAAGTCESRARQATRSSSIFGGERHEGESRTNARRNGATPACARRPLKHRVHSSRGEKQRAGLLPAFLLTASKACRDATPASSKKGEAAMARAGGDGASRVVFGEGVAIARSRRPSRRPVGGDALKWPMPFSHHAVPSRRREVLAPAKPGRRRSCHAHGGA